ncbi:MAG: NAD-dependent epimerase/dehydratase family protein [Actinobacteria bacterium]|nr:NAD-dependent epimerase/dehydratase family protein [Actinomycetota bacterium]
MKVLITGSSGQIGTNLALALQQRGDEVYGIDNRDNEWTDQVPGEKVDLVALSRDPASWEPPWRPDCVVHLAAWAKVHQLVLEPQKALENLEMTFSALEMARAAACPVVFGSSREVYGDIHRHVTEEGMADFVIAESPYSASKIGGEAMIYSYAKCYGLPVLIFRFSNVYGRFDSDADRMERVIPLFMRSIVDGKPITVFGKSKMLDFTYVDDCVTGVISGIEAVVDGKVKNDTINLAYGQGNTLHDLVNLLFLALARKVEVDYQPSRVGEVTRYVADISKARRILGYSPAIPLTAGIPLYTDWWKSQGWI